MWGASSRKTVLYPSRKEPPRGAGGHRWKPVQCKLAAPGCQWGDTWESSHILSKGIPPCQGSCEIWHQPSTPGRVPGGPSSWHWDGILSQVLFFHSWRSATHRKRRCYRKGDEIKCVLKQYNFPKKHFLLLVSFHLCPCHGAGTHLPALYYLWPHELHQPDGRSSSHISNSHGFSLTLHRPLPKGMGRIKHLPPYCTCLCRRESHLGVHQWF